MSHSSSEKLVKAIHRSTRRKYLAEQGYLDAQYNLGGMYHSGQGVPQDYKEAAKWYRKAAEQDEPDGQLKLAEMYRKGHGVPQDYEEAVKWYRQVAEQDVRIGQFLLGRMYRKGHGVPQDYVLAHMWFDLAAAQGMELAISARDTTAAEMPHEQIAEAQRLAREWRSKE